MARDEFINISMDSKNDLLMVVNIQYSLNNKSILKTKERAKQNHIYCVRFTLKLNWIYLSIYSRQNIMNIEWVTNPNKLQIELRSRDHHFQLELSPSFRLFLFIGWSNFNSFPFSTIHSLNANTSLWCQSFLYWIMLRFLNIKTMNMVFRTNYGFNRLIERTK